MGRIGTPLRFFPGANRVFSTECNFGIGTLSDLLAMQKGQTNGAKGRENGDDLLRVSIRDFRLWRRTDFTVNRAGHGN
jgi:hypothetical protein